MTHTNTTNPSAIKPSFDLVELLKDKANFDYDILAIDSIKDIFVSPYHLAECLGNFSSDYQVIRLLNIIDNHFDYDEFIEVLEGIDFNIGIRSHFVGEDFETEDDYNDYIRHNVDDFLRFAKYEEVSYILNVCNDARDIDVDLNILFNDITDSEYDIKRTIEKYKEIINKAINSIKALEAVRREIENAYITISRGWWIPELSDDANILLEYQYSLEKYSNFLKGYHYQEENQLIEKNALKQRLEAKLIELPKVKARKI